MGTPKIMLGEKLIDWIWQVMIVESYKFFATNAAWEEWVAMKQKEIDAEKERRRELYAASSKTK